MLGINGTESGANGTEDEDDYDGLMSAMAAMTLGAGAGGAGLGGLGDIDSDYALTEVHARRCGGGRGIGTLIFLIAVESAHPPFRFRSRPTRPW